MAKKKPAIEVKPIWLLIPILLFLAVFGLYLRHQSQAAKANQIPSDVSIKVTDGNELHSCRGNEPNLCKSAPSIDFFPGGSEGATNPEFNGDMKNAKEIMGRVEEVEGDFMELHTTSGKLFTVQFPQNTVDLFNFDRSPNYNNIKIKEDDAMYVFYTEQPGAEPTTILPNWIIKSSILLKDNPKTSKQLEPYELEENTAH